MREWLDELDIDGRGDDLTPATMVILGLAAAELRTAAAVLGLDGTRPYAVHTLMARADDLRGQFAELGSRTSTIHRGIVRSAADATAWAGSTPAGSLRMLARYCFERVAATSVATASVRQVGKAIWNFYIESGGGDLTAIRWQTTRRPCSSTRSLNRSSPFSGRRCRLSSDNRCAA